MDNLNEPESQLRLPTHISFEMKPRCDQCLAAQKIEVEDTEVKGVGFVGRTVTIIEVHDRKCPEHKSKGNKITFTVIRPGRTRNEERKNV